MKAKGTKSVKKPSIAQNQLDGKDVFTPYKAKTKKSKEKK